MTFPNLSGEKMIAVDIETKDPDLKTLGPGPRRSDTYICGVGIGTADKSWYFSLRHPDSQNVDETHFFNWLADTQKDKEIITANGSYDYDFLQYKVPMNMQIIRDIQITEFLLDSYAPSYSLDALATKYLGEQKQNDALKVWAAEHGKKVDKSHDVRRYIWEMPADVVRAYGEADPRQTIQVYLKQLPEIEAQELDRIHYIESRLIQVMLLMRRTGQRIDITRLQEADDRAKEIVKNSQAVLDSMAKPGFSTGSSADMAELFDKLGLSYPFTAPNKNTKNVEGFKPKPSFTADYLENLDHPIIEHILNVRRYGKLDSSFLGNLDKFLIGDRVHPIYHQARVSDKGTEYGRFSCTMPAIQTMPGDKQPELKKIVRTVFLPDEGCELGAPDYSQSDYRFFAHYAQGPGGHPLREYFQDPKADMHTFGAIAMGLYKADGSPDRSRVKAPNFGIMFGMGAKGLSLKIGKTYDEARAFLNEYKNKVPALRDTPKVMSQLWKQRGYVKTISGRRARMVDPTKEHLAIVMVIAGSTADLMKKGMVDAFDAGLYDVLPPHQTIHDELIVSIPKTRIGLEAFETLRETMQNAYQLRVPIIVSAESGPNWGEVDEKNYQSFNNSLA